MCNPVSIADLHRLAYPRFPKADVHQILHDAAEMRFRVQSLSECNAQQLETLRSFVMDHPVRNAESRNGNRTEPYRSTSRPRSGTPIPPGVVRLASPAQKGLIRRLFGELRWTDYLANRWLVRCYNAASIDRIATVQDASRIIQHLTRIKADKRSGRQSAVSRQRTRC